MSDTTLMCLVCAHMTWIQHGLPELLSDQVIDALNPQQVAAYLNGYGVLANADAVAKDALKRAVSGRS
jgi:hypothetical protein